MHLGHFMDVIGSKMIESYSIIVKSYCTCVMALAFIIHTLVMAFIIHNSHCTGVVIIYYIHNSYFHFHIVYHIVRSW